MYRLVHVSRSKMNFAALYELYAQQGVKEMGVGSLLLPQVLLYWTTGAFHSFCFSGGFVK